MSGAVFNSFQQFLHWNSMFWIMKSGEHSCFDPGVVGTFFTRDFSLFFSSFSLTGKGIHHSIRVSDRRSNSFKLVALVFENPFNSLFLSRKRNLSRNNEHHDWIEIPAATITAYPAGT